VNLENIGCLAGDWGPLSESCSVDDWDLTSDDSGEADWDSHSPFDELHFAGELGSRSAPEAGRREIRASDLCAARCWTALAAGSAALAVRFAAEERELNAEQERIAAGACYSDPDAARDSKTPSSR
jgi:hypothetical protein